MIKFIIQKDFYNNLYNYNLLTQTLDIYKIEYDSVRLIPYDMMIYNSEPVEINGVNTMTKYVPDTNNVIIFGSSKIAKIFNENYKGLFPASFDNENHDYLIYEKHYGDNLLNFNSKIISYHEKLPEGTPPLFFARPTKDNKLFTGGVFMEDSYYEHRKAQLENNIRYCDDGSIKVGNKNILDEQIIIAPLQEILCEIRCFIVGGEVVTMSEYRRNNRTIYKNVDNDFELKEKVQNFVNIYQPAESFVMDVCYLNSGELKIIEINCLNCSGFYDIDMGKLIQRLVIKYRK